MNFNKEGIIIKLVKYKWLYIMMLPGILYFVVFRYLPMLGVYMAFEDYQPHMGIFSSPFVGLKHFKAFFSQPTFLMLFKNTIILAGYNLVFYFPVPIILALMLNEVRKQTYKKIVQTVVYIPHFISWSVVVGIAYVMFTTQGGVVNSILESFGSEKINFLMNARLFRPFVVVEIIWKEAGWGTIIILAALAGIDMQLYEAAVIDGAKRWHQLWHITLPSIKSTIVILLILRLGSFMDSGFEQIFLMLNAMNREVGEVFDTYVYSIAMQTGQFSYSAAIGLFKSIVSLILVIVTNYLAKRAGEEGVY